MHYFNHYFPDLLFSKHRDNFQLLRPSFTPEILWRYFPTAQSILGKNKYFHYERDIFGGAIACKLKDVNVKVFRNWPKISHWTSSSDLNPNYTYF